MQTLMKIDRIVILEILIIRRNASNEVQNLLLNFDKWSFENIYRPNRVLCDIIRNFEHFTYLTSVYLLSSVMSDEVVLLMG